MRHYNTSFVEWFNRIFALKVSDQPDGEVLPYITPTVEVLPRVNIVRSSSQGTTGSATIYTTPADKDFYLQSFTASFNKNAACDIATGLISVDCRIDGVLAELHRFTVITLTAERADITISYPIPIKLDRNTAVRITGTFTAGVLQRSVSLTGYTVEVTR